LFSKGFSECKSLQTSHLQEERTLNKRETSESDIAQHNNLSWMWWLDMWDTLLQLENLNSGASSSRNSRRSALSAKMSLLRSSIEKTIGFPSKSAYFAFWKKLFLFDIVSNVARVGGSLLLYVFAPDLYQMLPAALVG
jgi:hypothetical protein